MSNKYISSSSKNIYDLFIHLLNVNDNLPMDKTIKKMKHYLMAEIHERETMRKALSKYIAVFDYFDKILIVLSATSDGVSIVSFATVISAVGITSASFWFSFFY